jgi:hypothetical protein
LVKTGRTDYNKKKDMRTYDSVDEGILWGLTRWILFLLKQKSVIEHGKSSSI